MTATVMAGCSSGTINVNGSLTTSGCAPTSVTITYWQNGESVGTATATPTGISPNFLYATTINGLASGASYYVTVSATLSGTAYATTPTTVTPTGCNAAKVVGKIAYKSGYPAKVAGKNTQLEIQGTVTPDCGWSIKGGVNGTYNAVAIQNGTNGITNYKNLQLSCSNFSIILSGLTPNTEYSIVTSVTLVNACNETVTIQVTGVQTTNK